MLNNAAVGNGLHEMVDCVIVWWWNDDGLPMPKHFGYHER